MGAVQPWHIVIVVLVFLLLFGAKRLPEGARALGKSMRIFKSEIKEMQADGKPSADAGSDGRTEADGRSAPHAAPTPIASERVDSPPSAAPSGSTAPRPTEHRSA